MGAKTPYQPLTNMFGKPASAKVGVSGAIDRRMSFATASARNFPDLMCLRLSAPAKTASTSPLIAAMTAGTPPWYGTCVSRTEADWESNSMARWLVFPYPAEATVTGWDFARRTRSDTDVILEVAPT
ncbi:hypothetical protein CBM2592_B160003 [Cupriavidus taiwanensis]|nr:hypothetical protein CBM2592_B160003 [Cupriavidus taiwanensis]SOY94846.1 hypothetical protein CBM2591_B150003 [Cupriavidus taiwanensis]